jgi:ferrous iron transport protein B
MAITKVAALAFLTLNLFSPPCFAAIGAMSAEMKSKKWLFGGIGLQLGVGYTVAYLVYTIGTLIVAPESLHIGGAIGGLAAIIALVVFVSILIAKANKKVELEQALKAQRRKERAMKI